MLPPPPWERRRAWTLLGVSEHLTDRLLNLELADLFEALLTKVDWKPSALANLLADRMRASRRAGLDWEQVLGTERIIGTIVWASDNKVSARGAHQMLDALTANPALTPTDAFLSVRPDPAP